MDTTRSKKSEQAKGSEPSELNARATENSRVVEDLVARRAYERFEERGREDGHDVEDWLAAERELGRREESERRNSN